MLRKITVFQKIGQVALALVFSCRLCASDHALQNLTEVDSAFIKSPCPFFWRNIAVEESTLGRRANFDLLQGAISSANRIEFSAIEKPNVISDCGAKIANFGNRLLVGVVNLCVSRCTESAGNTAEPTSECLFSEHSIGTNAQPVSGENTSETYAESPKQTLDWSDIHFLIVSGFISAVIGMLAGYFGTALLQRRGRDELGNSARDNLEK